MARKMAIVPGVVEVNSFDGQGKQYEVSLNPDKLLVCHVSIDGLNLQDFEI